MHKKTGTTMAGDVSEMPVEEALCIYSELIQVSNSNFLKAASEACVLATCQPAGAKTSSTPHQSIISLCLDS